MKKLDVAGEKYGRLLAVKAVPTENRRTKWLFRCDCGADHISDLDAVRRGFAQSCGCLHAEVTRARSLTHGHRVNRTSTPELKAHAHAKSRCTNPNDPKYPIYGARGIRMCEAWLNDPAAFLHDMGPRPAGHTLERKDSNGHYEPGNCEWATPHRQARTRRDNVLVMYQGVEMILKDYAALLGVSYKALHFRVRTRKQSLEAATAALLHAKPPS